MKILVNICLTLFLGMAVAQDTKERPNIIIIMGDDVGWFNIGAYNRGIMSGKTPHIDSIAQDGMLFTDYYAEPSCTAGRANFIAGQLPIRLGLTTVGLPGSDKGFPDKAPTIATALKELGYVTGEFGKNHFGDLNKFLPTVHGFDEYFGFLYHLDAMEDPFWHSYPQELWKKIGPRNMIHSWAGKIDDPAVQPRWGRIGKQRIEDKGPLSPKRMETVDDEIFSASLAFMKKAHQEKKPFFLWINPSRMHIFTHLSDPYKHKMNAKNSWYLYEAGLAQLDDLVGTVLKAVKELGIEKDTIIGFTTDNGAQILSWPDGGMTPFAGEKGTALEGGMRVPLVIKWPGKIPANTVQNQIMSGLDFFPTFLAAAGNPHIVDELKKGKRLLGKNYKVHLDGYNQLDLLLGKGPSKRHEIYYFDETQLGAVRIDDYKFRFIDQPTGWQGGKVTLNWPSIVNLRIDPFERGYAQPTALYNFFAHEFWRYVFVQEKIGQLARSFIDYPPLQPSAHFNLEGIKKQVIKTLEAKGLGD